LAALLLAVSTAEFAELLAEAPTGHGSFIPAVVIKLSNLDRLSPSQNLDSIMSEVLASIQPAEFRGRASEIPMNVCAGTTQARAV
jgi:hypothetical protein